MTCIQLRAFFVSVAAAILLASSVTHAQTGYNSLFIGHSFFVPFANGMPFYTAQAGIVGHTQTVVFSGGASGAPQALWEDASHAAEIKAVLDGGDVELFAMTYAGEYPTMEGYINWINYALDKNPNTRIAVAMLKVIAQTIMDESNAPPVYSATVPAVPLLGLAVLSGLLLFIEVVAIKVRLHNAPRQIEV